MSNQQYTIRKFVVFLVICIFSCLEILHTTTHARAYADKSQQLIAAIPHTFPPQYLVNKEGKSSGFAIDIMDAVARKAGLSVRYRIYDNGLKVYQAIKTGEAHLIPNKGETLLI
jgi:hypothetical protein